ncbi:GNAT family N-acetyltransferase [Labedella phragmitis]|uniref:GNAT family N-acetyltransferase n=1 Tax=Labedella phragmitis TaxID=2498849 RepID=A0A444PZC2_9MICO|nr:GNAT family N-acetyltransferase [Labedella phragmitis]RWZ53206.1 GNAT family N-acetyltransferase [Labedella phragmitis]
MTALGIRALEPRDRAAVARICLLTGRGGDDATGEYVDDEVLADVYATPYVEHETGFGVVAVDDTGRVEGYLLGTTDTVAFSRWFVEEWWPSVSTARVARTAADPSLLSAAADPERMLVSCVEEFPAHLHIDLLESVRGAGMGRRLVEAAAEQLRERGVPGVHLVVGESNASAIAFYRRTGFTEMIEDRGTVPGESIVFARRIEDQPSRVGRRSNQ